MERGHLAPNGTSGQGGARQRQGAYLRGYFGIGVLGISKAMNVGSLLRSAHAFGASFAFTIAAAYARGEGKLADTSDTPSSVPFYEFATLNDFRLPVGCSLVGVELTDEAIDLPRFRHPAACAYVLGAERTSLPPEFLARCAHVVKIPTRFSLNLALAGALVMYDRVLSLGGYPVRPTRPGGAPMPMTKVVFGAPRYGRNKGKRPAKGRFAGKGE
ncbi:MAG: RNA methyltransferase [Alphaproteobacteria bacterium]|nr:RNA methyltransferase [Alphaproteobacteria bacterium]